MAASPADVTSKLSSTRHLLRFQIAASNTTRSTSAATAAAASTISSDKPIFDFLLTPAFKKPQAESSDVASPLFERIDWRFPFFSYSSPMSNNPVSGDPSLVETRGGPRRVVSDEDEDEDENDDEYGDVDGEFVDEDFVDEDDFDGDDYDDEEEEEEEEEKAVRRKK